MIKLIALLLMLPAYVYGQSPQVPSRMEFAGIKLKLTDGAREEIQKDVDALTKSPKYLNIKVERAKTYFPIIERVFREEGLHEDFKYLVLQESALIPDAVSSSDAVGFWQFKDFTAMEVGLRVDKHVDERMNIVSSSRGAARYMKKNNQYFDNWLHALQAYQMGPGGAMRVLGKGQPGATSMVIDKETYWYVKKFLAHKIAFEHAVKGFGQTKLVEYPDARGRTLKDISQETGISVAQLENYNKWVRKGKIPEDKAYTVVLPVSTLNNVQLGSFQVQHKVQEKPALEYNFPAAEEFPDVEDEELALSGNIVDINRIPGIIGKAGDDIPTLARNGNVDLSEFLEYNDLDIKDKIVAGQVYYYKKKRAKAQAHFYVARPRDTWWSVSQKFGLRLKKLKQKNRIRGEENLKAGRVLWLRFIRPERIDIEFQVVPEESEEANNELAVTSDDSESKLAGHDVKQATTPDDEMSTNVSVNVLDSPEQIDAREEAAVDKVQSSSTNTIHIVRPGETLYSISKRYEVAVVDLLNWNGLSISDKISIGQELSVFNRSPSDVADVQVDPQLVYTVHVVSDGETLYNIARSYNVTIEQIMNWNNKKDFSIATGDKLRIKKPGEISEVEP